MKTFSVKQADIQRKQHTIDASDKILGRLAAQVATLLLGKHKPTFCRNMDIGDFVTIINASKVRVTGKKAQQKMYYRHSNYPGGFKVLGYTQIMESHPNRIIEYAVDGMLPHNRLRARMMNRLKVYAGAVPVEGKGVEEGKTAKAAAKIKPPKVQLTKVRAAPKAETAKAKAPPKAEAPKAEAAKAKPVKEEKKKA